MERDQFVRRSRSLGFGFRGPEGWLRTIERRSWRHGLLLSVNRTQCIVFYLEDIFLVVCGFCHSVQTRVDTKMATLSTTLSAMYKETSFQGTTRSSSS
ncbi:uncharacterized protein BDW43DRAFT_268483 [Aspergillus alliaceus]|uniref:uncharacterized protein n=1 Tax=Petromyces alliaceus TaxID=209559 RepID=UPI0012A579C3|nr:uncharacterized protein BDW43DRAFT_268483 [Aspergillus alliaceus]KAB8235869.1 hypothetical protein BDW43DRAFT_268483 [Aspergillus alliaceus]